MRRSIFALALSLLAVSALPACAMDGTEGDVADETSETDDALAASNGKFETFAGADGKTYFHLLAGNGEKVLASEGYASVGGALSGIASVKENGVDASRFEVRTAVNGETYFVLRAANGQVVATSETYASRANTDRAIATVAKIVAKTSIAAAATGAKFETFKGLDGKHYFHLRAGNGEIVLQSQAYAARSGATTGIASVQTNGKVATRYQLREAANGEWYFVLVAANGAVIGRGETYASKSNAQRGIDGLVALLGG